MGPLKGRGVVAREVIRKGQYVCEYRTHRVYPVGSAASWLPSIRGTERAAMSCTRPTLCLSSGLGSVSMPQGVSKTSGVSETLPKQATIRSQADLCLSEGNGESGWWQ